MHDSCFINKSLLTPSLHLYRMYKLTALLVVLNCHSLFFAEASTTFEDLALGGCQCKSCNCSSATQECPAQHKRAITAFSELQLGGCSCESCTCSKVLDSTDCSEKNPTLELKTYKSCKELYDNGKNESGVYPIYVNDTSFEVYCDMVTDGGGWTVFQRRKDGSVDFYRNWTDYKNGFGDLEGEFWLGLDKIHLLISNYTILRVDLRDSSSTAYAKYSTFTVGNESSKYKLNVTGYSGTAGDSLAYHNSMKFTTRDRDNDNHGSIQCADFRRGGWWYNACSYSNLNGLYLSGQDNIHGVEWRTWRNHVSIPFTEMKIKELM